MYRIGTRSFDLHQTHGHSLFDERRASLGSISSQQLDHQAPKIEAEASLMDQLLDWSRGTVVEPVHREKRSPANFANR